MCLIQKLLDISYYFFILRFQNIVCFFFNKFIYLFIYFIFGSSLLSAGSCGERGLLFVAVHGLLMAVASLVAEHGL